MIPPNLADNDVFGHYRDPFRANDARPDFAVWTAIVITEAFNPGSKSFAVPSGRTGGDSEQIALPPVSGRVG